MDFDELIDKLSRLFHDRYNNVIVYKILNENWPQRSRNVVMCKYHNAEIAEQE